MLPITGYVDRWSVRPGEELATDQPQPSRPLPERLKAAARAVTPPIVADAVRRRRERRR